MWGKISVIPHSVNKSSRYIDCNVYMVSIFTSQCPFKDLSEAGMVLRHRMKQSSKLICKRKLGNQAVKRCFVGSEAIDWLRKISPLVHGRFHAIAMLQALLEEGVITHGKVD